ncbi:MAG: hypothetical protein H8D22_00190 [Candidatus Cloacimonetes bacterium]|nr:hypothetical protein [Candidatus Cloacimonadota bacterium]
MRAKNIFIILFSLLLTLSCGEDNPPPEPEIIWSLQTGNNWTYVDSLFIRDSVKVDTVFCEIDSIGNIDYNGELIPVSFLREEIINDKIQTDSLIKYLYRNEDDGLYSYGKIIESVDTTYSYISRNLKFKFPVNIGDKWECNSDTMECISKDMDFLTPNGSFKCYVYKTNDIYYYCVPYVGIVGIIQENRSYEVVYKRLLIYFNIGEL